MSHRHRRDEKSSSHYDRAKHNTRQTFNKPFKDFDNRRGQFNINLYQNDRQERISALADDEDGDLIAERQPQFSGSEKTSRIIEANDRRHDAVIFGDKTTEEQQKNQLWDSFKQSSKYSTTSLAGPLLLEDLESKRLRWKTKMRELWIQRHGAKTNAEIETS
ncbi:unnamed protein product [Adineta ricciae]|uniref:Uncharacterized protein n=1 Tax=Adineta ricciae TaxID=249248 RepID=A0A813PGR3_ADIRI|nr:unnamed protein product [Adineta ricciae]CAF0845591.1 unnamed protein product [Adineta ricciae]